MTEKVVVDPGHGGRDPGGTGNGMQEKDITLPIALETEKALLADWKVEVILTRRRDEYVSIANRASLGRGASLFISQHLDWNASPAVRGFWTFRNTTTRPETFGYQKILHEEAYKTIGQFGLPDRGLRRANHDITRLPPVSTVLYEYGFITNPLDAAVFSDDKNLKLIGQATARGIARALGLSRKQAPSPPLPPPSEPLGTVVRPIGVRIEGKQTNHQARLLQIGDSFGTFGRLHPILDELGYEVEPHGTYVNIVKKKR